MLRELIVASQSEGMKAVNEVALAAKRSRKLREMRARAKRRAGTVGIRLGDPNLFVGNQPH